MKIYIEGEKIRGTFQKRVNRFIAEVKVGSQLVVVHVANTGRMKELLTPGAEVLLRRVNEPHRKTNYDLLMVYHKGILVSIDSKLPNRLLYQGFINKEIVAFDKFNEVKREVTYGKSRLDLALINEEKELVLIEAKCVTLVKEGELASFPDAPTERGTRHVRELTEAVKQNIRGAVFFIVQREDAVRFTPNKEMDPQFQQAVTEAKKAGVEFYAYNCIVTEDYIAINDELEIF
ncbi:sugar fermentation stimulation protein [Alkaliphilus metalliredigens QYMF]|uniref:Sugar fermentation stimulation protein homolog n=1 Tax=Alkaliphilus metalliredigens (strain QYMF) TaxID=293826 RepID=SFSA_ALKMQ|nr:DNA/RNA nuclease SfsA [Alkaliphilus metalliredigens]A6TR01.1 RecName: Full=Sugar fermentation stimulation protein homolog [Alkaliphilus metalliredigens QYMF]ABR48619.1 sugar fermentation stimulation protein [Alkaliphilus metalliredigens QYMF]